MMPGNEEAWMIYSRCSGQVIGDMGGPVDINVLAVLAVMELEGIEDKRDCLSRVQTLAWGVIGEQRKKDSRESEREH